MPPSRRGLQTLVQQHRLKQPGQQSQSVVAARPLSLAAGGQRPMFNQGSAMGFGSTMKQSPLSPPPLVPTVPVPTVSLPYPHVAAGSPVPAVPTNWQQYRGPGRPRLTTATSPTTEGPTTASPTKAATGVPQSSEQTKAIETPTKRPRHHRMAPFEAGAVAIAALPDNSPRDTCYCQHRAQGRGQVQVPRAATLRMKQMTSVTRTTLVIVTPCHSLQVF